MKRIAAATAAFCIAALCARTATASEPGVTSVSMLKYDVGGQALSMAGAMTASADDVYAMYYNPAGLALLRSPELSGMFQSGIMDTRMGFFGGALPLAVPGITGNGEATLGVGLLYSDNGMLDWYATNSDGSMAQNGTGVNAGGDTVLNLTYAEKIGTSQETLGRHYDRTTLTLDQYIGASGKFISSKLPDTNASMVSATAFAGDLGYRVDAREWNTSLGLSVMNLGTKITYKDVANDLPLSMRGGLAWHYIFDSGKTLGLSSDVLYYEKEQATSVLLGTDFALDKFASLRAGYKLLADSGGLTAGLGMRLDNVAMDFGFAFNNEIGNTCQFDLRYRFGRDKDYVYKPKRDARIVDIDAQSADETTPAPQPKAVKKAKSRADTSGNEYYQDEGDSDSSAKTPPPAKKKSSSSSTTKQQNPDDGVMLY
jgi:hypothetical protein